MPGIYKALTFFLVSKTYGTSILGELASWQAIAQIAGYFTAIGWSTLILVRIPRSSNKEERVDVFNRLTSMGTYTLIIALAILTITGLVTNEKKSCFQIGLWLSAWTYYQIPRHYFISLKEYRKALTLDSTVIILSVVSLLAPEDRASAFLAMSMLSVGIFSIMVIKNFKLNYISPKAYEIKGLEFGLANMLGGGVSLTLIPLSSYFEGAKFAGELSLFISITAISLLVPRAISLNQLPQISNSLENPKLLEELIPILRKNTRASNIATSIFCIAIIILMASSPKEHHSLTAICAYLLIAIQNAINIESSIDATLLMAKEKSKQSLQINMHVSLIYFAITSWIYIQRSTYSFILVCILITILSLYRLHKTRHFAKLAYSNIKQ